MYCTDLPSSAGGHVLQRWGVPSMHAGDLRSGDQPGRSQDSQCSPFTTMYVQIMRMLNVSADCEDAEPVGLSRATSMHAARWHGPIPGKIPATDEAHGAQTIHSPSVLADSKHHFRKHDPWPLTTASLSRRTTMGIAAAGRLRHVILAGLSGFIEPGDAASHQRYTA